MKSAGLMQSVIGRIPNFRIRWVAIPEENNSMEELYFSFDRHWKPEGHLYAASVIADELELP